MRALVLFIIFNISLVFYVRAQIAINTWRDHLSYSIVYKVLKAGDKIYCATEQNLFIYNISTSNIEKLTTISGLSDVGVSNISYNAEKDILLISYVNGNIDLVKGTQVNNIPDLKNKIINTRKGANSVLFSGNYAYCCHDFGILVVDMVKNEIKDTYILGEAGVVFATRSMNILDNYFYVTTDKGIFKAPVSDPFLTDYTRWSRLDNIILPNRKFGTMLSFNGSLIVNSIGEGAARDTLYVLNNSTWVKVNNTGYSNLKEITTTGNHLVLTNPQEVQVLDQNYELIFRYDKFAPMSAISDGSILWVGDYGNGLTKVPMNGAEVSYLYPPGPASNYVWNMKMHNNTLLVTAGGVDGSWANTGLPAMVYKFQDGLWSNIWNNTVSYKYKVRDYISICGDPRDPQRFYIGSWGHGVFEYRNNELTGTFNESNSTIQNIIPNEPYMFIGGITFDTDSNMWLTNQQVANPISVRKADGTWKSFNYSVGTITLGDIMQDINGNFWVIRPRRQGLFAFNLNGTFNDESDDVTVAFFPKDELGTSMSDIYCIVTDKDGSVWCGTEIGPVVYSNPIEIFEGNTGGMQPKVPRKNDNLYVDPLLYGEAVMSIAVDGANRKWMGTEKSGVYLISADGTKELLHFTTKNSPLLSDFVRAVAIHPTTGEVFFGTDKGIISYRGTATESNENMDNAYVFPNPVRPEYNGPITITGLVANASVKITDISGNLVYQTSSLGGSAIWDGKTRNGNRAASGVYLVFLTNEDGEITKVIKFLMIR